MKQIFDTLDKWLTNTPIGQVFKLFVFTSITLLISDSLQHGEIVWSDWQTWLLVPAGPLLSVGYDYLSKSYPIFGVTAKAALSSPSVDPTIKKVIKTAQDTPNPLND
jgi:hypothetical protein